MNILSLINSLKMEEKIKFSKKIDAKLNVTMFHGQKDEVVPVYFSKRFYLFLRERIRRL